MEKEQYLWVEKYRPKTLKETILPKKLKTSLQRFVDEGNIPNLLLSGPPGVGKTTSAMAMLEEMGCDYMMINGSLNLDKDSLRHEIKNFASTVSFGGGRKYIILDEADYLSPHHVQPALRNFMEQYSSNCGFILTCNYTTKIIEALRSRCSMVSFDIEPEDRAEMATQFFRRLTKILDENEVEYETKVVAELIKTHFPDWRKVLNQTQLHAANGKIDVGILSVVETDVDDLFKLLRDKDFTGMREWVSKHSDMDTEKLYEQLYKSLTKYMSNTTSIAEAVVTLAEYQYKEAFVASVSINRAACFATLMATGVWK